ncbi:MAG TPA: hypothetical protein VMZ03_07340 [Chitinophagaceae bacterium]|nr:hypothetical protein [Chitinophagaceae bacterium]
MKKLILFFVAVFGFLFANAQTDSLKQDSLQQYVGKYKFPDGSFVSEINVTLENGILSAASSAGSAQLKRTDSKDVFDIVEFSGTATFKRSEDGKVKTLRVQVNDIDMEGTKEEPKKDGEKKNGSLPG